MFKTKITSKIGRLDTSNVLISMVLSSLMLDYAIGSILLGLFIGHTFLISILNKTFSINLSKELLASVLLFSWLAATYFWSEDKELSIKGITRVLPLLVVPVAIHNLPKLEKENVFFILKVFTWSNVIFGVFFIINSTLRYMDSGSLSEFTYHELVQELELNAIYVSAFFSMSIFYLFTKPNRTKVDTILTFIFFGFLILLSSKTIIICVLINSILYGFIIKDIIKANKKKVFIGFAALCVLTFFTSKEIQNRFDEELNTEISEVLNNEKFNKVYPWTGSSIRLLQLRILKEQLEEDNIFWKGFGLFASRENLVQRHKTFNTYRGYHNYNYHNLYAQIFAESGIFGFLGLITMLILSLTKAIKVKDFLFFSFMVLTVVWYFTESVLWVQRGVIFASVFYCLFNHVNYKFELKS